MKNSTLFNLFKRNASCCCCLLFLLLMGLSSQKTNAQGTLVPACNLIGPLTSCVVSDPNDTSGDMIINVDVARSGVPDLNGPNNNQNFTYTFVTNSAGAFIRTFGPVIYNAGTNRTTQTLQVFPGTTTSEFNLQLNVINKTSIPNTVCECSKSVSVSRIGISADFDPILCAGATTTLNVHGQFSDQNFYTYTLLPSGPSNNDGVFGNLPGSVAGITYTVSCESAEECTIAISRTIFAPAASPIILDCPADITADPCLTQDDVDEAFDAWLDSFDFSGGTNSVSHRSPESPTAPSRCGGSTQVTWTVTDDCGQSETCTKTFTVPAPPPVSLTCPNNPTTEACLSQEAINGLFTAWLATASGSGGCNGQLTNNNDGAPSRCGGSKTVTFTYTSSCAPFTSTCQATFTVPAPPPVQLNCAISTSTAACQTQDQVNTAYNAWLLTANASGGCNGNLTNNSDGAPPACGGSKTVTFTYTSSCAPFTTTCQATFTVNSPETVSLTCPTDSSTGACQSQEAVNAAYNAWLQTAHGSGGCGGQLSNNSTGAPAACGGSKTVTFTYTSTCAPLTSTCQATFTVNAPPTVQLNCPINQVIDGGLTQEAVNAAFQTWLETASASGGCGGVLTNNNNGAPNNCNDSRTVTFTYTSNCAPFTTTCQATFATRTCIVSHIFPTQTTCCNFISGTATGLANVCTKLKGNSRKVDNAIPGVFFYYSRVVAPGPSFTINVKQTNDGDLNKLFTIPNIQQVRFTTANCGNASFVGSMLNGNTEAKYQVTGATTGATYIVSVKYEVKSIIGATYTGADNVCTYTFASYINNVIDNTTAQGIDAVAGCSDNTPLPPSCDLPVVAKQAASIKATVYPNPSDGTFKFNVESVSTQDLQIKVIDMLGKVVETTSVRMSDIDRFELGRRYPSGVYNIIISQGTEVKTQRVIKK